MLNVPNPDKPYVISTSGMNKCLGCFTCANVCAIVNHDSHSLEKSAIRIRTVGGMTTNYIAVVCVGCEEPACKEACPADALSKRPGGGVLLDSEKCYGCRKCVLACSIGAVNFDKFANKPIICHHCGVCTTFCTHNCLIMLEAGEGEAQ